MKARVKMTKSSGNVFRDIGFPEEEAQNLLLRSDLMMKIDEFVEKNGLTQKQAAKILGVTQPRVNLLLNGKIQYFSLDALVNMASRAGMRVKLSVSRSVSKKAA